MASTEYSKGYAAGRREARLTKDELIMFEATAMVLRYCTNWSICGKAINNAEGYVRLARIFADNIIKKSR